MGYTTDEYMGPTNSGGDIDDDDEDDDDDDGGEGSSLTTTQDEGEQSIQGSNDEFGNSLVEVKSSLQDELPALIFYDCELTGGNIHSDHIIEVCGKVVVVSDVVAISKPTYSSLIHSS